LEGEFENLRVARNDAQLAANLTRAQQLAEEARELIVGGYASAARTIAEVLGRLAAIETEVRALSTYLPPDTAAIHIEAFRGYCLTLGEGVKLPAVNSNTADFWPTGPRFRQQMESEIYARN
jgi:hypothetical protein